MHKGSRHDILGIFEDMHRFQDGLVPRPKFLHNATATGVVGGGLFDATPYFGSHVPNPDGELSLVAFYLFVMLTFHCILHIF